jgi:hypothetical protein
MVRKIDDHIVAFEVTGAEPDEPPNVVHMHEKLKRPPMLQGSTYKIKTPLSEHSLYVTINDIILNEGTEHELRRPFEIFINSKNMDHFQWIVALTRIMSAVFRKGGDVTFLLEELHSVFDPRGGYMKKGGRFVPSLVAEIGDVLEKHLKMIGILEEETDKHRVNYLAEKRATLRETVAPSDASAHGAVDGAGDADSDFPVSSEVCSKCRTKAVVYLDGCMTCLSCGDSHCG